MRPRKQQWVRECGAQQVPLQDWAGATKPMASCLLPKCKLHPDASHLRIAPCACARDISLPTSLASAKFARCRFTPDRTLPLRSFPWKPSMHPACGDEAMPVCGAMLATWDHLTCHEQDLQEALELTADIDHRFRHGSRSNFKREICTSVGKLIERRDLAAIRVLIRCNVPAPLWRVYCLWLRLTIRAFSFCI